MDDEARYEAVRSRDERFDGVFFTGVLTTGIYCRPSCPAVTPRRQNVRFFPSAAAAQGAGLRACRRCRPDAVPGSAEWNVRADLVGRAMRMIADGVVDREGVDGLARRLGYSVRQVRRQLTAELGAGPVALARVQRAHTARVLLQTTALPVTEIAFASGFASVRQFNDTIREIHARPPRELRARSRTRVSAEGGGVALRLAHRGPYATGEVLDFLQRRAVPGVEEVDGEPGARTYRRTLALPYGHGIAEIGEAGSETGSGANGAADGGPGSGTGGGWLPCRLHLTDLRDLTTAVQRVRRLFDMDADPYAVTERLGADPLLGPLVRRRPGLRSPGTTDPHELAVRAVLGQQVTVGAARTLAGALVQAYGKPLPAPDGTLTHLFPEPGSLAGAPLTELRMPDARRRAIRTLAEALADGTLVLDPGADRDEAERTLLALRGIGPWTAGYVRMRALGDPDVFLPGDAGVRQGLARIGATAGHAEGWRPWRAYALHHRWVAADPKKPAHPANTETPNTTTPNTATPSTATPSTATPNTTATERR